MGSVTADILGVAVEEAEDRVVGTVVAEDEGGNT